MSKHEIEFCTNDEWLCDGRFEAEGTPYTRTELAREYIDAAVTAAEADPRLSECEIIRAQGQRITFHGWNGAHFKTRCGCFASFGRLTKDIEAALHEADDKGQAAVEAMLAEYQESAE